MSKKRKKKSVRRFGSLQVVTLCISTALVLVLLGMVVFSVLSARNLSSYMKENFIVTLTLNDDLSDQEAQTLCKDLRKRRYIAGITFISKQQMLKENTVELGVDPTEFAGENPFPSTIEMQLKADYANSESLAWIGKELTAIDKISDISYPKDLMDDINGMLERVSIILLSLAVLLMIISFSLINNTVQLSIYARRFSIHTMKLVGASWNFIRWPFIKRALVEGLVAAIFAVLGIAGIIYAIYCSEPGILDVVTWEVMAITAAAVVLFGLLITTFCSYLSVNKYLRMTAGDLYKI